MSRTNGWWKLGAASLLLAGCFTGVFGDDYTPLYCTGDTDCGSGRRCLRAKAGSTCVTPEQAACPGGTCAEGTTCVAGTCRTVCEGTASLPCLSGQACVGATCVNTSDPSRDPGATGGGAGSSGSGGSGGVASGGVGGSSAGGSTGQAGPGDACEPGKFSCPVPTKCNAPALAPKEGICTTSCLESSACQALGANLNCVTIDGGNYCLPPCTNGAQCAIYGPHWSCSFKTPPQNLAHCFVYPCADPSQCASGSCNPGGWCNP